MKKILLLLCALLTTVGTWAYTTVTLGSQVTDLSTLSAEKYYVLKNVGSSKYNCFDGTQMTPTDEVDYSAVVVLNYDGANVTIKQVNADQYYQGLVNNERLTLGNDPVNYTFNTDGVEAGQFRFANNSLYMNRNGGDEQFPMGAGTNFTGGYSRWNIYEVTVIDGYVLTYSTSTGSYTSTNSQGTWAKAWQSTATDPSFTLTTTANNIKVADGSIWSGGSGCTYTLTAQTGFLIKGYTIKGTANTSAQTLTPAEGGSAVEFGTDKEYTLTVTGLSTQTTSFNHSTPNNGISISSFTVIVDASPATVQYVVFNDNEVELFRSNAVSAIVGSNITALPSEYQHPYCSYNVTPITVVEGENVVNVTVSYNLPFTVSTDFENATWYYAKLRGKYLRADDSAKDSSGRYATNSTNEHTDAYKWAFFGNPYAGIYVMNKNQGDGKFLYKPDAQFVFQTVNDPTAQNNTLFEATPNGNDGFTLRSLTGSTMYINDAGNNGNLGFWNNSAGKTDGGSKWVVEEVPDVAIDVTYELWVGGEKVNTVIDEQVAQNSDVNIPASLTSAYSALVYDFDTEGSIGTENCTITVTGTLKTGVVTALSGLSNSKAYRLVTERGTFTTDNGALTNTCKSGSNYSVYNFAIVNYEDAYYLWSVEDGKFVAGNNTDLTATPTAITINVLDEALFKFQCGSQYLNCNTNSGGFFDTWSTTDGGNKVAIIEAADFDATGVLAALEAYLHPANYYDRVAEEVLPYLMDGENPSASIGKPFGLSTEAATAIVSTYMTQLNNQQFSQEEYEAIVAAKNAGIIDHPADGYYFVKNASTNKYLRAISLGNRGGVVADVADPSTVPAAVIEVRTVEDKQYMLSNNAWLNWVYPSSGYEAMTSGGKDKYVHWLAGAPGQGAFSIALGNGEGSYANYLTTGYYTAKGDENGNIWGGDGSSNAAQWIFEQAEEITLALNEVGGNSYATTYLPFGITFDGNVKAYKLAIEGSWAVPTVIGKDGYSVPAGTPVLLFAKEEVESITATITSASMEEVTDNELEGSYFASSPNAYVLNAIGDEVGFYVLNGTLAANRAYLPRTVEVKGFALNWDLTTGIEGVAANAGNKTIFNLAGQRVQNAQKGIYIVNGKKVVVK
ncbi:MAG: hypothetical protein J5486_00425 [Bacteroidaceae bacterium]|nr:hypothetical protein [Bacteroidaceae bacterium]